MNFTEIRKILLKLFLGFLGLTAFIAIVAVISGDFSDFEIKILLTSMTISIASIGAMSCAAFIERRRFVKVGLSGIALCVLSAVVLILGFWLEISDDNYWRIALTFVVASTATAHAFLLYLPDLNDKLWIQHVTALSIGLVALLVTILIWFEPYNDVFFQSIAVATILVALETLAIPILMKLQPKQKLQKEQVILEHLEGVIYQDSAGNMYELKALDPIQES